KSRDLSARFNSALASLAFGNGDFYIAEQLFTSRNQLPKNPTVGFKLLADKGIEKIVLDLSNNSDRQIIVAHYINKLLFPDIQNFSLSFKQRQTLHLIVLWTLLEIIHIFVEMFRLTTLQKVLELPIPPKLSWTEKDIIILTNGLC
ncbi:18069_t:CDS:2, partial [Dentiscutata erythropus]